jgi:hypothetical protein
MSAHFKHPDDIERIVRGFLDCTLPCSEWTHEAHLTVALWHAREYAPAEALDRVRSGIRRYNVACGKENSATAGYHETVTRFYMWLVGKYLDGISDRTDWQAVTNRLIAEFGAREVPMRWYTRDLLMSPAARAAWIEPDLRPLD